jgi:hypothetical protein
MNRFVYWLVIVVAVFIWIMLFLQLFPIDGYRPSFDEVAPRLALLCVVGLGLGGVVSLINRIFFPYERQMQRDFRGNDTYSADSDDDDTDYDGSDSD